VKVILSGYVVPFTAHSKYVVSLFVFLLGDWMMRLVW